MRKSTAIAIVVAAVALMAMIGGGQPSKSNSGELTQEQKARIVLDCAEHPDAFRCR